MPNEVLLFLTVFIDFGGVVLFYYLFGRGGLFAWTVLATISANIEVLLVVDAFGLEQTLGNVLFASTFLVTDILSEMYSKKVAETAVNIGILASVFFIVISQLWLVFTPSASDWAMESIQAIFSNTPRLMLSSFLVYAISQRFDVWAYHKWWDFTSNKFGDRSRFLWLRNNGSTLISQLLNAVLFNVAAFWGTYDAGTLISLCAATYVIYIACSLLDTPFVYLARKIHPLSDRVVEE